MNTLRNSIRMRGAISSLAALLLTGCAEVPTSEVPEDSFPFRVEVTTRTDVSQRHFTARIQNQSKQGEPNATFLLQLVEGTRVLASSSAATGLIEAGETRELTVSFDRTISFKCYEWRVSTTDGRRRVWDNC